MLAAMTDQDNLRFRPARPADAAAIARLQADSWQRHYRGAYTGDFLDHEVAGFLLDLWADRMSAPQPMTRTILAEYEGAVVGLAHTILAQDPTWGSLIDNLHVSYDLKRHGIGTRLLALTGAAVSAWSAGSGVFLWVLEQNTDAQAFYAASGGTCVERAAAPAPGGVPGRLNGVPIALRYAWPDGQALVRRG
jgi:ribosomal protein S18 acetylase RimI-like enzyme